MIRYLYLFTGSLLAVLAIANSYYFCRVAQPSSQQLSATCTSKCSPLIRTALIGSIDGSSAENCDDLLEEIRVKRDGLVAVPVKEFPHSQLLKTHRPIVLVHADGHLHLVVNDIHDNGVWSFQVVHGSGSPFFVRESEISSDAYSAVWLLPEGDWPPSVQHKVGGGCFELSKCIHSFGVTKPFSKHSVDIKLTNVGATELRIGDTPLTSCSCTVSEVIGGPVVLPGESATLRLSLETSNATSIRQEAIPEVFDVETGVLQRVPLLLCATQPKALEVTPTRLDFGRILPSDTGTRNVYLREADVDRFEIIEKSIDVGQLPLTVKVSKRLLANDLNEYQLACVLDPAKASPGRHSGKLQIMTTSSLRPSVAIPITFEIGSPVKAVPPSFALGVATVGTTSSGHVRLRSNGSAGPLSASLVREPSNAKASIEPDGDSVIIHLNMSPVTAGVWNDELVVQVSGEFGSSLLTLPCSALVFSKD